MRQSKGLCGIPGCSGQTHLGWRPLTERMGRKICEQHWRRHRDQQDSFDLFEAFGFRRPPGLPKPAPKERQKRKPKSVLKESPEQKPIDTRNSTGGGKFKLATEVARQCRDCGDPREPGHRYCEKCGEKRKAESNRKRQQRHYRDKKPNAFARPLSKAVS